MCDTLTLQAKHAIYRVTQSFILQNILTACIFNISFEKDDDDEGEEKAKLINEVLQLQNTLEGNDRFVCDRTKQECFIHVVIIDMIFSSLCNKIAEKIQMCKTRLLIRQIQKSGHGELDGPNSKASRNFSTT